MNEDNTNESELVSKEEFDKVLAKKNELLNEVKLAKAQAKESASMAEELKALKEKLASISDEDLVAIKAKKEKEATEVVGKENIGEMAKILKDLQLKQENELKKVREEAEAEKKAQILRNEALVKQYGLSDAINKNRIHPSFVKAVEAMLKPKIEVAEDEYGNQFAAVDFDGSKVPVENYLTTWLTSEEGSVFKEAPVVSGGGATSVNGGKIVSNPWVKGKSFNVTEQCRIMRSNPAKAEQLKAAAGIK